MSEMRGTLLLRDTLVAGRSIDRTDFRHFGNREAGLGLREVERIAYPMSRRLLGRSRDAETRWRVQSSCKSPRPRSSPEHVGVLRRAQDSKMKIHKLLEGTSMLFSCDHVGEEHPRCRSKSLAIDTLAGFSDPQTTLQHTSTIS